MNVWILWQNNTTNDKAHNHVPEKKNLHRMLIISIKKKNIGIQAVLGHEHF